MSPMACFLSSEMWLAIFIVLSGSRTKRGAAACLDDEGGKMPLVLAQLWRLPSLPHKRGLSLVNFCVDLKATEFFFRVFVLETKIKAWV